MTNSVLSRVACPSCGKPVALHNVTTQTVVCKSCGAYVAIGMGEPELLAQGRRFQSKTPIQVGARGILNGTDYIVLGHVQYEGWDEKDRSDRWKWDEFLLGGADGMMAWLSHDEKGYGLFRRQRPTGAFDIRISPNIPVAGNPKVAERYPAKIVGARGELTWRARPGDALYMAEGAAGGQRYSVQQSKEELEIYVGQSVAELDVARAFGDTAWVKRVENRVAACAFASRIAIVCIVFAAIALLMAAFFDSGGERVLQENFLVTEPGQAFYYDVELNQINRPAIVSLRTTALNDNSYAEFEINVTSPNEAMTPLFDKVLWHETGFDSDGFWRETSYHVSNMFVPTVAGLHRLEIISDPQNTANLPYNMTLIVRRNHITPLWLVVYGVLVGIVGGVALLRAMA